MTEPCDLSAVEARRLIGAKQLSPVELLRSCRRRIDRVNHAVKAVTDTIWGRAMREAKAAEKAVMAGDDLKALHGLPLGVKDLDDAQGLINSFGSPIFANNLVKEDDRMVRRCRAAGAIVVGKTNVPEFGAGANSNNPVYGPTGNPFDPRRTPGGSSGGSAVALATSMLPLCTGSDGGGSLRIPAAFCGIVGFRPSPGLVPTDTRAQGWNMIPTQGPMGRSVADTCLLLSAQAAFDELDPLSRPIDGEVFLDPAAMDLSRLRVGYTVDWGVCPVDKAIAETFRRRIGKLGSLFRACDRITPGMGRAHEAFGVLRATGMLNAQRANYAKHRNLLGPNMIANYEEGLRYSAADVAWAQAEQTRIYRAVQAVYEDYDLILSPTVAIPPFPWSQLYMNEINGKRLNTYYHWFSLTYMISLTGNPSLSLPMGLEPTGTPFGLMITGPAAADLFTLSAAHSIEQAVAGDKELCRPVPDLKKLAKAAPITRDYKVTTPPLDRKPWRGIG
ncbi:MAG: amidase [Proteobacteria bacterium]|nr:amidase [Pseudomonadota bacterium]MBI3498309.1 amidase [Pseudomonadota bacterium]